MSTSDEILLDGIFEKVKRGMPLAREDWNLWFTFVLNSKYQISTVSEAEFGGMKAQLQQGVRKTFLSGGQ